MDDFHAEPRHAPSVPPGSPGGGWLGAAAVYGGAALLGAYLFQNHATRDAEAAHPPIGRFLEVDGTVLHYVDIGSGPPVVLIHGAGTTLDDWFISGVLDQLLDHHRLIVVDRPGSGYSARPGSVRWTPERQGRAIAHLMHRLGADDAVVVGHSFGVLPAMSMALAPGNAVRALVLIAGAYAPGASLTGAAASLPQIPLVGPLARATVAPSMARAAIPAVVAAMFEPQPVSPGFWDAYPAGLVARPSQIEADAEDAAALDSATVRLTDQRARLTCPITLVCGSGDAIFDPDLHSRRFARAMPGARLVVVPAAGHMVHHSAPAAVAATIGETLALASRPPRSADPAQPADTATGGPASTSSAASGDTPTASASPAGGSTGGEKAAGSADVKSGTSAKPTAKRRNARRSGSRGSSSKGSS